MNLPLAMPVSDAKVLAGRSKPLEPVSPLFAKNCGMGFSYPVHTGGPAQYAHAVKLRRY